MRPQSHVRPARAQAISSSKLMLEMPQPIIRTSLREYVSPASAPLRVLTRSEPGAVVPLDLKLSTSDVHA